MRSWLSWIEQQTTNLWVGSSNLSGRTTKKYRVACFPAGQACMHAGVGQQLANMYGQTWPYFFAPSLSDCWVLFCINHAGHLQGCGQYFIPAVLRIN